jgi:hypothetical protein
MRETTVALGDIAIASLFLFEVSNLLQRPAKTYDPSQMLAIQRAVDCGAQSL